jgi:hypothetical protein
MIEDLLRPQHLVLLIAAAIVLAVLVVVASAAIFAVRWLWRRMPAERSQ